VAARLPMALDGTWMAAASAHERSVRMPVPSSVDEYLTTVPEPYRAALLELRETIRAVVPEATETISYRIPTVKVSGRSLVAYAAFKDHCSLFPMSMSVIAAHERQLAPYRAHKGTIHFTPERPLPKPLVRRLIRARLAEIAARTKTGRTKAGSSPAAPRV